MLLSVLRRRRTYRHPGIHMARVASGDGGSGFTEGTLRVDTTSTSATWGPQTVIKSGDTMTWYLTDDSDNLLEQETANAPTFDLSSNPGTRRAYIESPDGYSGLTEFKISSMDVSAADLTLATALVDIDIRNGSMTSIDISTMPNLDDLRLDGNDLTEIDASDNPVLGLILAENNELASITLGSTSFSHLFLGNNNLTAIDVSGQSSLGDLRLDNNSLPEAQVDQVLIDLDNAGNTNGSLEYQGNADPSSASKTAYDNLVAKGWTITGTAPP